MNDGLPMERVAGGANELNVLDRRRERNGGEVRIRDRI